MSTAPHMSKPKTQDVKTNKMAIASFICGLLGITCITGIIGVILGIISLIQINGSNGRQKGSVLATFGIVLSILFGIIGVLVLLLLPAVMQVRTAARRTTSTNQMRQILLAHHQHESVHACFPGTGLTQENGSQLSWRVHILPYLERQELYQQFKLDEPWDSPHNKALIPLMPEIYSHIKLQLEPGKTVYVRPVGEGAFKYPADEKVSFSNFMDGSSNTIILLEADETEAVIWTKPDADYQIDPSNPKRGLGNVFPGVILAGFADGSSQDISKQVSDEVMKGLYTHGGGEMVSPGGF